MSESDQSLKINEFTGITNVDPERARFYLESAAWDIDVMRKYLYILTSVLFLIDLYLILDFQSALASFFDNGGDDPSMDSLAQAPSRPVTVSNRDVPVASASSYKPAAKPKKWQPQSNRFVTFLSMIIESYLMYNIDKTYRYCILYFFSFTNEMKFEYSVSIYWEYYWI